MSIAMHADRAAATAVPVASPTFEGQMTLFRFLRVCRDNRLSAFPQDAYEADIGEIHLLRRCIYIVNEPSAVKRILADNAANYPRTNMAKRLLQPCLGRGLVTMDGEEWRRHRRIMAPSLDYRTSLSYWPIVADATAKLINEWKALPDGSVAEVDRAMQRLTLQIVSRAMFSSDSDEIVEVLAECVDRYQDRVRLGLFDLLGLPSWIPGLNFFLHRPDRIFAEFDKLVLKLIAARRQRPDGGRLDLLARLIANRDEDGRGLAIRELRDEIVTIFTAGYETTSSALTWTWYLLSEHRNVEAKLHAELDTILGNRSPCGDDVDHLKYARNILDETMRLYPPIPIMSRHAIDDDELLGRRIPAGSTVIVAPWLIHRHRKIWEHPDRFDPDRFGRISARHRFAHIPFSGGPHLCIGATFAMMEAVLVLATVAQRFRLQLVPGHPVEPQSIITLRCRHGMKMIIEHRQDRFNAANLCSSP